jgi:NADH-quinone oxidoreductase subunit H
MISMKLALGLSFVGPIILGGSMSIGDIVEAQRGAWFALLQPVRLPIYFMASVAEITGALRHAPKRAGTDCGYHVEYSGMKFALLYGGIHQDDCRGDAIGSSLFRAGTRGPFVDQVPWLGTSLPVHQGGNLALCADLDPGDHAPHPV